MNKIIRMIVRRMVIVLLTCLVGSRSSTEAFVVGSTTTTTTITTTTTTTTTTALLMGRKSRGKLASLTTTLDGLNDITTKRKKKKMTERKSTKSKRSSVPAAKGEPGKISPALAEWMSNQQEQQQEQQDGAVDVKSRDDNNNNNDDDDDDTTQSGPSEVTFESFEDIPSTSTSTTTFDKQSKRNQKNTRRIKQSARKEVEAQRNSQVDAAVDALEAALEEQGGNWQGILSSVRSLLLEQPSGSLRTLVATSKKRTNYRLAWAGSDEAVCHLGTGLHKAPLARLQEVFFNLLGKNRLEVLEVIRVLGPFPNVRNTLQGNCKVGTVNDGSVQWMDIVMDSMVDGTGKEIRAGTDDNIRRVPLQINFCDERAIVAVVPTGDGNNSNDKVRSDPMENNGSNLLVFVREDSLDDKLDALRVS